jgi:anaerobic selenocysteine-containing dehydrogenase
METLRTACTRDCPDACSLLATVEDGVVTKLAGDPSHPITRGFLCYRVGTHYLARHASKERLLRPLLRANGTFREISYDAALDLAAERLGRIVKESGGAAVLHSQGGGSLGILKNLNKRFARLLGASATSGDVCDGAGSHANEEDFGAVDSNDPRDVLNAGALVLFGRNIGSSSPHLVPLLREAKARGIAVWSIDPLPTKASELADVALTPRPGGDAALALGAARIVLDRGDVDPDIETYAEGTQACFDLLRSRSVAEWAAEADLPVADLERLASLFVERAPITSWLGWGLQRRANGATQVRAIDALHAITGNLGRKGAGAAFGVARRRPFDLSMVTELAGRVPRSLPVARLGDAILEAKDPAVRAVVIDNHNPVATNADSRTTIRALESREFTLVLDPFLTDTARAAHLVIPTTTMLEEDDLIGSYGHHHVAASRAVARRPDGLRTDLEIYQGLAARLGFGSELAGDPAVWMDRMLGKLGKHGVTRASLLAGGAVVDPAAKPVAFAGRHFATSSGRMRLIAEHVPPPPRDAQYPLHFQALSTNRWQASQLTDEDEEREGPLVVTAHPDACDGVPDGGRARLASRIGALEVTVRHDARFRRDTVYAPRARSVARGLCVNELIRARLTDFGGGCAYYDEGVRLEKLV